MSKDIISMLDYKIINYLKFVLQPWYVLQFSEKKTPLYHPLYHFQVNTLFHYTFEQAIMMFFRIAQLREYRTELFVISTIYMRKVCVFINNKYKINNVYTPTSITTVFFICLLLASKYYMDDPIENKELHRIAFYNVITLEYFNYLEIKLLELIDYNLYVTEEEYILYENMLK